jgi:hypothetical protein
VSDLLDVFTGAASTASIELRSNVTPTISTPLYDPSASAKQEGLAGVVGRLLKPAVTIHTPYGDQVFAPYGEPDGDAGRLIAAIVLGLAVFGALKVLDK